MSEFKGTKGKWTIVKDELFSINSVVCNGIVICDLKINKHDDFLISKAPEMLEMLQKVVLMTETCNGTFQDFRERYNIEIKELIKQATEL